jgi:hypothetical protein
MVLFTPQVRPFLVSPHGEREREIERDSERVLPAKDKSILG